MKWLRYGQRFTFHKFFFYIYLSPRFSTSYPTLLNIIFTWRNGYGTNSFFLFTKLISIFISIFSHHFFLSPTIHLIESKLYGNFLFKVKSYNVIFLTGFLLLLIDKDIELDLIHRTPANVIQCYFIYITDSVILIKLESSSYLRVPLF